ncbi:MULTISPECIES: SsrA-binding protein SmpB [Leuconostoc]|mgnify:FL=1|uniref:SsrA-binding protein n=2 Tax=Leuconostoc kimchii TaxID=136609 RepID=D5T344_LEUKI|nr:MULTISPECIES: SsrA-binding protein SmpB [Leuconostoc]ADG40693.1 SsrA-binding protein [Leuconostoc kimchii IMSNU 11154]AEJ31330.1 SsrA-binding protein [Leuconostoc sp. C2]QBR47146.1 SsrA-binding protein SmpB [Leuconostoc kimchii]
MAKKKQNTDKYLAQNRKARFNYAIAETFEAGLSLTGTEIKSVRSGQITIGDGFVTIHDGNAMLTNVNIASYEQGNQFNVDPIRSRQLLLHKHEIATLSKAASEAGVTIVPLKVYLKHGFAKVLIGIGRGKKKYDKREDIKRRDQERELRRRLKN